MRIIRTIFLTSVFVLILTACGAKTPPPSAVNVSVKEWMIEPMDMTVAAGNVTFTVTNDGTLDHDFAIENAGKIDLITPGDTKTLEVTLEPGTYNILCDLAGHKEAGMTGTLTVVAP